MTASHVSLLGGLGRLLSPYTQFRTAAPTRHPSNVEGGVGGGARQAGVTSRAVYWPHVQLRVLFKVGVKHVETEEGENEGIKGTRRHNQDDPRPQFPSQPLTVPVYRLSLICCPRDGRLIACDCLLPRGDMMSVSCVAL